MQFDGAKPLFTHLEIILLRNKIVLAILGSMGSSRKLAAKICVFCTVGLLLLTSPFVVSTKLHDAQLEQLQHEIETVAHPPNSTFLARHSEIGNFGNGNHIDYWAVELRSTTGDRSTLKTNYDNVRVPVPNADDDASQEVNQGKQPIEWQLLPSPLPARFYLSVGHNSGQWNLSSFAGRKGLYTVQVVNSGENDSAATFFDWRGD